MIDITDPDTDVERLYYGFRNHIEECGQLSCWKHSSIMPMVIYWYFYDKKIPIHLDSTKLLSLTWYKAGFLSKKHFNAYNGRVAGIYYRCLK